MIDASQKIILKVQKINWLDLQCFKTWH